MICAGYCAYGSATELVLTYGHGIQRFTLDPSIGEFILTAENMKLPPKLKEIYSVNDGNIYIIFNFLFHMRYNNFIISSTYTIIYQRRTILLGISISERILCNR